MAKISILIALLPHLLCALVHGQPSPCSDYFTYMTNPRITGILGQIEVRPPSVNDTFILKVALHTITERPSQVPELKLARTIQESLRNVYQGKTLMYHVYYRLTDEPIPLVSAIWFNDKQYCPNSEVSGYITATIELGHILYPPNEEPLVYNDGSWQLISLPWHRNTSLYHINNPNYDHLNNETQLNNECGITSYYSDETNRLIRDGEKTSPGQWPWLVAIYIQRPDNESAYDFKCAGSLLTTRHVMAEEFCLVRNSALFKNFNGDTYVDPQRVHVSLGQLQSREWHGNQTGIINRIIVDYKIYQYNKSVSEILKRNGLAILILKTAIEYNPFIRPVCLWSGSTNLQDAANMMGYVVGWGYDVTGTSVNSTYQIYAEEPRMVKMLLRNIYERTFYEEKILMFRQEHLRYYRPCTFGGGLVVFNITTNRYQLRGVAIQCASTAAYIDVAHHLSWIREQISII